LALAPLSNSKIWQDPDDRHQCYDGQRKFGVEERERNGQEVKGEAGEMLDALRVVLMFEIAGA
jgi:hypothetical protein